MQWGDPRIERPFLNMKYWGKGVLCISGHSPQKRFENEFMQFQVLMGRESYDMLELT